MKHSQNSDVLVRPSPAEGAVLRALVEHGTIRRAAEALNLSPHTVDTHLDNLRRRTQLRYLPQLIGWAIREGWIG